MASGHTLAPGDEGVNRGYLADGRGEDLDALLSLRGSLPAEQADALERRIAEAWSSWQTSS